MTRSAKSSVNPKGQQELMNFNILYIQIFQAKSPNIMV